MNKLDILKMALQNLLRRKVRTVLTMLGVLIGTTSIVVMISLGIGLKESITKDMENWGGSLNNITIRTSVRYDDEGNPIGTPKALNDEAVKQFKAMEGVTAVSPGINIDGEALWGRKEGYLRIIGLDAEAMKEFDFKLKSGRYLKEEDRYGILLGGMVGYDFRDPKKKFSETDNISWEDRFKDEYNPTLKMLDERITASVNNPNGKTKRYNFNVVGILDPKKMDKAYEAYASIDEIKSIRKYQIGPQKPKKIKTKNGYVTGPSKEDYSFIWVRTKDIDASKALTKEIRDMGYEARSMVDQLDGIEKMSKTIQAILGGIGGITLFVAAIGIINTMIMSIYERTREIGVMKVIGATFGDVRLLFLSEAGLIGLGGGITGLGLSYLASHIVNILAVGAFGDPTMDSVSISVIPLWLSLFALGFSIFIGLVAGIYPANRAVSLSPIEAIKTE